MLSHAKRAFQALTGLYIYRRLPHGNDLFYDLKNGNVEIDISVIVDVGANVGQSAEHYSDAFPQAAIYCFEPVPASYELLVHNTKDRSNIRCFHAAVGSHVGSTKISTIGTATSNRIVKGGKVEGETVPIITLDQFCEEQKLRHINYLKIDTEGGDLDVVLGADEMLKNQNVDIIEVEAGMSRMNELHVPLEDFKKHLESKSYFLFGFYEQVSESSRGMCNLRRANMVFISSRLVKR